MIKEETGKERRETARPSIISELLHDIINRAPTHPRDLSARVYSIYIYIYTFLPRLNFPWKTKPVRFTNLIGKALLILSDLISSRRRSVSTRCQAIFNCRRFNFQPFRPLRSRNINITLIIVTFIAIYNALLLFIHGCVDTKQR